MRNNKLIYGIGLLLLALVIFYIGSDLSNGSLFRKRSKESGKTITDSMMTPSLNSILSNSNCTIELIPSEEERVVYTYDNGYYQNKSQFRNGEIDIDFEHDDFTFFHMGSIPEVNVKVYLKSINKIVQSGVGEIFTNDSLRSSQLEVTNDGVGDIHLNVAIQGELIAENDGLGEIKLKGYCHSAKLINQGTGDIEATNLLTKIASVINDGVGDVYVTASDTLHLTNDGTGDIEYSGNGHVASMKSDGVGEIKKK